MLRGKLAPYSATQLRLSIASEESTLKPGHVNRKLLQGRTRIRRSVHPYWRRVGSRSASSLQSLVRVLKGMMVGSGKTECCGNRPRARRKLPEKNVSDTQAQDFEDDMIDYRDPETHPPRGN